MAVFVLGLHCSPLTIPTNLAKADDHRGVLSAGREQGSVSYFSRPETQP